MTGVQGGAGAARPRPAAVLGRANQALLFGVPGVESGPDAVRSGLVGIGRA
jgi:hypothetical protein